MGLAAAHDRNLIHRDIKPDNIWLESKTGRIKILDFGLVRATVEDSGLTQSGMVLGTPRYMAPEQALGEEVDARSDLFSLGSVLYHLLTGKPAFEGPSLGATLVAVVHKEPQPIESLVPGINQELVDLIQRLMSKQPEARPATAGEVAKQLSAINRRLKQAAEEVNTVPLTPVASVASDNEALSAKPPLASPPRKPPNKKLLAIGAGGLMLALLGIFVVTIRDKDGNETVFRVPAGTEVDVDAQPGSKVTIREEASSDEQPKSVPDASPMMAKSQEPSIPQAETNSLEVDYDAERRAAQAIADKMTVGWMILIDEQNQQHRIDVTQRMLPSRNFYIEQISQIPEMDDDLFSLLSKCRNLELVDVTGNANTTLEGLCHLAKVSGLKTLNVSWMPQIDSGVLELFVNWRELESVNLNHCALEVKLFPSNAVFAEMQFLGLRGAQVSKSSLQALATACPHLERLDISHGDRPATYDLTPVIHFKDLETLHCSGYQLSDVNLGALANAPNLRNIHLESPVADPAGCIQKLLMLNGKLKELHLFIWADWDTGPSPEDYDAIARLTELEALELGGNGGSPTNDQLLQIAKLPKLKSLNVRFDDAPRHFDMSGIAACQRLRPDLEIVVDGLTYRGSPWPEWNREKQAAEPATAPPSEPTFDPAIERKVAERLLRLNKGRFLLGDRNKTPVPQWELAALSISTEPFCILEADLANVGLTDDELPALKGCQAITKLILDDNANLSSAAFNRLGPMSSLQHLSATGTAIDDGFVPWLAGSAALAELNLSQTKLSPEAMASLPGLVLLKDLTLPDTISAKAIQRVIEQAPQLTELNAIVVDQAALDALNTQLKPSTLNIAGSVLTDQAVTSIKSNNRLESLVIHDPTPASIALTAQLDQLVSLALSFGAATELGNQDLAPATKMKRLNRLSLSGQIQPNQKLLQQLAAMRGLQSLTLPPIDETASQALRQQRPDLELVIGDRRFPALDDWPGKFEGSPAIAAWDLPADAPQPAIYPFSPEEASKHQQAWAKYLGVPVDSENSLGMKFRLIPPGELVVDTPRSHWSPARVALERIDKAFEIGTTEVTVAQFEAFVKATGYKTEAERMGNGWSLKDGGWAARPEVTWRTPGYEVKPNLPVTVVSPSDAKAFCDWLSEKEG